jgi:mono/diheme cytochrome c family protein
MNWRAGFSRRRALALLLFAPAAFAHDTITTKLLWTQEISRLMNKHCVSCHRDGGLAMSLATYDEARPWAKAIRDEVLARRMPPWGAVKGVGEFRGDPSLSQIEIDMIVNWVEGGAPKGDDIYLPPAPQFGTAETTPHPAGPELTVTTAAALTLSAPAELAGLRPARMAPGESLDVTAYKPDGAVERLIWIRGWRPQWQRTYYFLNPVRLPKGTRIAAYSGKAAEAILISASN